MRMLIYKIVPERLWRAAEALAQFDGAPVDVADGYIHFSTGAQVRETAAKHFAGARGLLLVTVEAERLGDALRFEASRGGDLFPHLYAPLQLADVLRIDALPLRDDGTHDFSGLVP
ncbi:MAG: DUF952 domain-containing protein [Methylobacteriaceae bacterium]|nr:DUF952 domain-containing protein [Methylobacteriaceae bacterium]